MVEFLSHIPKETECLLSYDSLGNVFELVGDYDIGVVSPTEVIELVRFFDTLVSEIEIHVMEAPTAIYDGEQILAKSMAAMSIEHIKAFFYAEYENWTDIFLYQIRKFNTVDPHTLEPQVKYKIRFAVKEDH